jgi:uroporphyrinogen decarboxylase
MAAILNLEEPDRVAIYDSIWPETFDRWKREGLFEVSDASEYFGFDLAFISCDLTPGYEGLTYKESDRWVLGCTSYGSVGRDHVEGGALTRAEEAAVQSTVYDVEDFKERVEPFLDINDPRRLCSPNSPFRKYLKQNITDLGERFLVLASLRGPYVYCVSLCGMKRLLSSMVKNPGFVKYMIDKISKFTSEASKSLIDLGVDGLFLREDMAYKNGPFFSPQAYKNLIMPGHRRIFTTYRRRGLPAVLHCDGDFKPLISYLIRAGVSAIQPLEVNAGMDVRELKPKYGDEIAFFGNIDKNMLSGTLEQVRQEVMSKIEVACPGGGYVIGSDHSVPSTVPLQNYEYMIKLAKKQGRYKP